MKRAAQLILNLGITFGCFWWTFKDTDWDKLWHSLTTANYWWLVPYLGILFLIHLARTLRWGHWLSAQERMSFKKLNEAAGIGFMMFDARRAGSVVEIMLGMVVLGLLWYAVDAWVLAPIERATGQRWGMVTRER